MSDTDAQKLKQKRIWATGAAFMELIKAQTDYPRHAEKHVLRLTAPLFRGGEPEGFQGASFGGRREIMFGLADLGFSLMCNRIGLALLEQQRILRLRIYRAESVPDDTSQHRILYEFVSTSFYVLFTCATDSSGMGGSLKAHGDSLFQILAQSFELEIETVNISYDEYTRLEYQLQALDTAQSRAQSR